VHIVELSSLIYRSAHALNSAQL